MEYQIFCFGDGEILKGLFNAIAMCLNSHSGSLYVPLVRLSLIIGSLWAVLFAIYGNYLKAMTGWIVPMTAIMQLLFVPQVSVWVIDPVSRYQQRIEHVPYGLAVVSSYISRIGYAVTQQIEKVFVLPDDLKYQKTGALFASNLIQQAKTFHITNEDLAENMRQFVGQCVAYDALLGRKYTLADLRHSDNIWQLVSNNASPVRSFLWRGIKERGQPAARPEIITCRTGVQRFNQQWRAEVERCSNIFGKKIFGSNPLIQPGRELLRYLPLSYQYLTDMAQSAEEILKQNMMIYAVIEGFEQKSTALGNAPNFALRRAYLQQRTTYETLGAMAAESLPTMRAVLEAIAYATFLFVIPLAILPFGWRFLSAWVQILLWLQMWAPLYAVLNYIMSMAARSKSIAAMSISNQAGVTIASSLGLVNANADMAAMAGYLAMSIPFLCIALVKGVGTFVSLASHLGNITQGAASQAATDAVTGNYSFGNISQGNRQISNLSMLNQSYAASFRSGSFHQTDGRSDLMTTADGQQILNVSSSNIPVSINAAETKTAQLSQQASKSYQKAVNESEASSTNLQSSYRNLVELSDHFSTSQHLTDQLSNSKNVEQIKAIQKVSQMMESVGKESGLSKQQSADLVAEAGAGANAAYLNAGGNLRLSGTAYDQEVYRKAEQLSQSEDFQEAVREAVQASQSLSYSSSDETSKRLSENVSGSYEKSDHFRQEAMKSYRASEDYQRQAIHTQANATSINANLTQDFVDWFANQRADNTDGRIGKQGAGHIMANDSRLTMMYAEQFLNEKGINPGKSPEILREGNSGNRMRSSYENDKISNTYVPSKEYVQQLKTLGENENFGLDEARVSALQQDVLIKHNKGQDDIGNARSHINQGVSQGKTEFNIRKNKQVAGQAVVAESQHVTRLVNLLKKDPSTEEGQGENQTKN